MAGTSRTSDDAFRVARSLAIEQYGAVEGALCVLFAGLAGMEHDRASLIFYKIGHSATRNKMIASLIDYVHGERFSAFWDTQSRVRGEKSVESFWSFIANLDSVRNNIVHWVLAQNVAATPTGQERWDDLRPAFAHVRGKGERPIRTAELNDFVSRAEYAELMIVQFHLATVKPKNLADELPRWLQLFQAPHAFPPPPGHPVIRLLPNR